MSTSGVYSFNLTRDQIIQEALINCGAFDPEGSATPSATQLSQGALRLNALIKAYQTDGLQIWTRKMGVVFLNNTPNLNNGVPIYVLGSNGTVGGDHASLSHVQTTTTSSASAGASSIVVTSITGISNGDNIGIQLSTGALQWTTVNGAPAGSTVTLAAVLTASVNTGAMVYAYTTKLARPIRIHDGYMRASAGNDSPIRVLAKEEWERFGVKTSTGTATQVYLEPVIGSANLFIYPVTTDVSYRLFLELHYPFQDFVSGSDNPDFPQEWLNALIWGLTQELAPSYGVTEKRWGMILAMAEKWHTYALNSSQENSVYMQPDPTMFWGWNQNR